MWVDVLEMKMLGKEKSFLNKEGKRIASHVAELTFQLPGSETVHRVIGLCGTQVCEQLHEMHGDCEMVRRAKLRMDISPSRNNPEYRFSACYVVEVKS